jgi:hypothetical protein
MASAAAWALHSMVVAVVVVVVVTCVDAVHGPRSVPSVGALARSRAHTASMPRARCASWHRDSGGCRFYDADFDGRPMQAFEITDQDGNSLGPFQMPTSNYQDYIVDLSTLNTGVGLKPFHRGTKLVNATDRGWRLDYYNTGITGSVYSTVLSGPITTISPGVYLLTVDMQLRWSEEGDSLDRLGQGANSHIALALADFNSFTLTIDAPGSARMVANLFETTTTTGSPTASPTGPPVPSTSSAASTVTETPANRGPGPSGTFEGCMEEARLAAEARQMDDSSSSSSTSPRSAKKSGVLPEDRRQCEQQFRSECEHGKGKGKSKKKKKKGDNCGGKKKGVSFSVALFFLVPGMVRSACCGRES